MEKQLAGEQGAVQAGRCGRVRSAGVTAMFHSMTTVREADATAHLGHPGSGGLGGGQVSLFACVGRCFRVSACTGRSEIPACVGVGVKELFENMRQDDTASLEGHQKGILHRAKLRV